VTPALGVLAAGILASPLRDPWLGILMAGALSALAGCAVLRGQVRWPWPATAAFAIAVFGLLQGVFRSTVYAWPTFAAAVTWAGLAAAALLLDWGDFQSARRWLFRFATLTGALALVQFFTSGGRIYWFLATEVDAVLGPFANRNHFASFALLAIPLSIPELRLRRWDAWLGVGLLGAGILAGGSRAGALLLGAEAGALAWLLLPRWRVGWSALAVSGILLTAAGTGLSSRLLEAGSYTDRLSIWASSLELVQARPAAGHGLGTFETVYPAYLRFDNGLTVDHAHSDWLEWAVEGGTLMVLPLAMLAMWTLRRVIHHPWGLGAVAVFLHATVDYPLHKPEIAALQFAVLGLVAAAERSRMESCRSRFTAPAVSEYRIRSGGWSGKPVWTRLSSSFRSLSALARE